MNHPQTSLPQFLPALLILGAAFAPLFLTPAAQAAVIIWDASAVNINTQTASQVSKAGDFFAAADFNSALSGLTYNVNGVDFSNGGGHLFMQAQGYGYYGTDPGPTTTYSSIVNAIGYTASGSTYLIPIQITGLTAGQIYQVQIFGGYANSTAPTRFSDVAPIGNNALNESPTVLNGFGGTVPQYVLGTFEADLSGSQNIYYYGDIGYGYVAAMQLRAVPEPSTVALAALGATTVLFRLRRKQRNA